MGKPVFTEITCWLVVVEGKHKKELVLPLPDCLEQ